MTKNIGKKIFILAILIIFIFATISTTSGVAFANENQIEKVYLGGNPIGIIAGGKGLLVTEFINVLSKNGSYSPALEAGLQKGDIILSVNGKPISNIVELNSQISKSNNIILIVQRGEKRLKINIKPIFDIVQNANKIGITVKNHIAGIGTVTFVKTNGEYGALGHQIIDSYGNGDIYQNGKVYYCGINKFKVASDGIPGELIGKINIDLPSIGTINKNYFCGIYGTITNQTFYERNKQIQVGHKIDVIPGKAYIHTTIDENGPKMYEIDIVKAVSQNKPDEKGMVIRITDKRLLSTTKGILQGMSGSPIIQNGKLVGAVTHVFTNNSTMGYGIYIDWMINQ